MCGHFEDTGEAVDTKFVRFLRDVTREEVDAVYCDTCPSGVIFKAGQTYEYDGNDNSVWTENYNNYFWPLKDSFEFVTA
jgi:hypothetical protein